MRHYHFDDPDVRDVHIGQFLLISEHLGSFPWTASRFSLVPWLPSAPITCSFEDMAPGKRARRLEFAIAIVGDVEAKWSRIVIESILEDFPCRFAIAGAVRSGEKSS